MKRPVGVAELQLARPVPGTQAAPDWLQAPELIAFCLTWLKSTKNSPRSNLPPSEASPLLVEPPFRPL